MLEVFLRFGLSAAAASMSAGNVFAESERSGWPRPLQNLQMWMQFKA
ncbi:hypothetical protein HMPREF9371_1597 [Neisseria shayeganii 871]|uniref:Uncharacterized protein n=1 Tax=Neisseria shayeganii 871 TaxID=1032488 RepID=G4CJ08_9NEIS|nr:hypothetical protein HMPREF9371_1597 [Neisseria shayeganii 871]